ncbi:unnamed protein product, partial [Staurois parvus]
MFCVLWETRYSECRALGFSNTFSNTLKKDEEEEQSFL